MLDLDGDGEIDKYELSFGFYLLIFLLILIINI